MMYIKAQYPLFPNEGTITIFIQVVGEEGESVWFEATREDDLIHSMKVHQGPLPDGVVELSDADSSIAQFRELARAIVLGTFAKAQFTRSFGAMVIHSYNPDADHGQQASLN